jgi:hypothetical protein
MDDRVEAAEHGAIEKLRMIGRGDEQAFGLILLEKLENRVSTRRISPTSFSRPRSPARALRRLRR